MKQLPIFRRIVFVDWHGVLSKDLFWTSILGNGDHPLHSQLSSHISKIFAEKTTVENWMRGLISTAEIVGEMDIPTDGRFKAGFLSKRLHEDCRRMRVNVGLFKFLSELRPVIPIVLATDNMDCFAEAFGKARARRRRPGDEAAHLVEWAQVVDDVICSSEVGALKAEDPARFFGPTLSDYGIGFSDALLIDDRADNCEAFRRAGGKTIRWKMGTHDLSEVKEILQGWLGSALDRDMQRDTCVSVEQGFLPL